MFLLAHLNITLMHTDTAGLGGPYFYR